MQMIPEVLREYQAHMSERQKKGIPPLPLSARQVAALSYLVFDPPEGEQEHILTLLKDRVPPGVDPAALEKARLLRSIALHEKSSPIVSPQDAVEMLGMMKGGYNLETLIELLEGEELGNAAARALSNTILVFGFFDKIRELSGSSQYARKVVESWANADWFTGSPILPDSLKATIFKVQGEVNTDDLSPASRAASRPDIPLHALHMLENRCINAISESEELGKKGHKIAFAADVAGTGSSRKSAMNSIIWWIGEDIPGVPNKRRGGIILGNQIAPIFFNTARDSGAIPIRCDVSGLKSGMIITIDLAKRIILDEGGNKITEFRVEPETIPDEYRAGGRLSLIIGKELTRKAQNALGKRKDIFLESPSPHISSSGYTLAQKIVGKACGLAGVRPGQSCLPKITTVGSQDTTGPMTADEIKELVCLEFGAPLVMQSFCHTAAYPTPEDRKMHKEIYGFFRDRGGVVLKPGDGIIHSWLNRMLLPDTVGTGGDSHTRFPVGISFPAGSGLVAFAAALGFMPLDMPESVLVRFTGRLRKGIFLRDAVNAIPYYAVQQEKLSLEKENKKNVFNGRIMEIEGLDISVEEAFEFTDSSAERSAEAAAITLSEDQVSMHLKDSISILNALSNDGYASAALEKRINEMEEWLSHPSLLKRDMDSEYADIIDIDLSDIKEPLLACPNDPDYIRPLSEAAGERIDEVFIGSCMTNLSHFRHSAEILRKDGIIISKLWLSPPTRLVEQYLIQTGDYDIFKKVGARLEIPGCSLCMGNQARAADNSSVFSTSTRNFDNRMGRNTKVYLGSAELAAVVSTLGRIPSNEEYFSKFD